MASLSGKTETRRRLRQRKCGKRRKSQEARKSTPASTELFAALGEPGKPAPKR